MQTCPWSGFNKPAMILSKVLLPEPDAPIRPTIVLRRNREIDILQNFELPAAGAESFADTAQADCRRCLLRAVTRLLCDFGLIHDDDFSYTSWRCRSLRFGAFFPTEQIIFQRLEHAHFDRRHHDHQGQGPGEDLVGPDQVRGLPQTITDAARRTDGFSDQRHAPAEAESEPGAGEKIRQESSADRFLS